MTAYTADTRPLVALDWSHSCVHVTFDGQSVQRLAGTEDLLAELQVPHKIVAESTFESWDAERRARLVAALRAAGHELYVYRPLHTSRYRNNHNIAKSDTADARVIHAIASAGQLHVYPVPEPDLAWSRRVSELNRTYGQIRHAGGKAQLAAQAAAALGPYRQQNDDTRLALGNGKQYSESLLAAAAFAAAHSSNRAEFERLLGLHGSAYPSLLRSDVHHHSFRHARNRGATWPLYRREVRRLFWRLREREAPTCSP